LNDLAEWLARKLRLRVVNNRLLGNNQRKVFLQIFYLLLAGLVSANLLWYFIEPQRFFRSLLSGEMRFGVWVTLAGLTLIVYLDLALVRRLLCRDFCPYGRIQTSLLDPGTLVLQLPENERPRCIRCHSCVRCCPMGIDIRAGYQVECINCGRCLDACRQVMFRRGQPGLIHYTFGLDNLGAKALLNLKILLLSLAFVVLLATLSVAIYHRAGATLKVALSHTAASRLLKSGEQVTFFNAWINNRGTDSDTFRLVAQRENGPPLILKGQTAELRLAGGKNRQLDYVLLSPPAVEPYMVEFILVNNEHEIVATAKAQILPLPTD
jgi:polyferredoxin